MVCAAYRKRNDRKFEELAVRYKEIASYYWERKEKKRLTQKSTEPKDGHLETESPRIDL